MNATTAIVTSTPIHKVSATSWRLRELAANLLRVAAGAGHRPDLPEQAAAFLAAYREAVGFHGRQDSISAFATMDKALQERLHLNPRDDDLGFARGLLVQAALRQTAGEFAGQMTQARNAESKLVEAMRECERVREERRQGAAGRDTLASVRASP
jgi:hypothetical protein